MLTATGCRGTTDGWLRHPDNAHRTGDPVRSGASSSANTADFTIHGYKFPPLTATAGQKLTVTDARGRRQHR